LTRARPALNSVTHRVLHERLHRHGRHDRVPGVGGHVDLDVQDVPEARLLQSQIALDVVDFLAQGYVRASIPEQVAGELREVDQKLTGLIGPDVNVAGHCGQRVV